MQTQGRTSTERRCANAYRKAHELGIQPRQLAASGAWIVGSATGTDGEDHAVVWDTGATTAG